jgi:taurine dioxygenase
MGENHSTTEEVTVNPIQASCGADIVGFDFSTLPDDHVNIVHAAWLKYGVLRFRGYDVSDEEHVKFTKLFGDWVPVKAKESMHKDHEEITVISNAKVDGKSIGVLGNVDLEWHTDSWFFKEPPSGEILHAITLPSSGGDTYWVNSKGIPLFSFLKYYPQWLGASLIVRHCSRPLNQR